MRLLTVCSFVFVGVTMWGLPVLCAANDQGRPQMPDAGMAKAQKDATQKEAEKEKPEAPPAAAPKGGAINLNSATLDQLETLPGVGRKMAERIVEYRQKSGGFKKIEDLMNVKGIGEKNFLKLKPLVSVTAKSDKAGQ
jgi:comEA protein